MLILIILCLIVLYIVVSLIISNIKKKAYKKGYYDGCKDMGGKLIDISYWFTSKPMIYNALYIFGVKMSNNPHFSTWNFRDNVLEIGDRRVTDLENKEYYLK